MIWCFLRKGPLGSTLCDFMRDCGLKSRGMWEHFGQFLSCTYSLLIKLLWFIWSLLLLRFSLWRVIHSLSLLRLYLDDLPTCIPFGCKVTTFSGRTKASNVRSGQLSLLRGSLAFLCLKVFFAFTSLQGVCIHQHFVHVLMSLCTHTSHLYLLCLLTAEEIIGSSLSFLECLTACMKFSMRNKRMLVVDDTRWSHRSIGDVWRLCHKVSDFRWEREGPEQRALTSSTCLGSPGGAALGTGWVRRDENWMLPKWQGSHLKRGDQSQDWQLQTCQPSPRKPTTPSFYTHHWFA